MTHLSPDFWSRRHVVTRVHGVYGTAEIIAVTSDGLIGTTAFPGNINAYGTRIIAWEDIDAWYPSVEAATTAAARKADTAAAARKADTAAAA